eukprot:753032-Rhodomonas_salina.3
MEDKGWRMEGGLEGGRKRVGGGMEEEGGGRMRIGGGIEEQGGRTEEHGGDSTAFAIAVPRMSHHTLSQYRTPHATIRPPTRMAPYALRGGRAESNTRSHNLWGSRLGGLQMKGACILDEGPFVG